MPKVPKHLIDLQRRLLAEAEEYGAECDQKASERLYLAWMHLLMAQCPAVPQTQEQTVSDDRTVFAALAHLIGSWLATQHCDVCREQWASRLALLAYRIGCVTAAEHTVPADAVRH